MRGPLGTHHHQLQVGGFVKERETSRPPLVRVFLVRSMEDAEESLREREGEAKNNKKSKTMGVGFPMSRVKRLVRCEADLRTTQDVVFLINKAAERFVELFAEDAYAYAKQEHKKFISYKHLSSVVHNRKRYDFLSDFVPEKLRAEDASSEMALAGT